MLKLNYNVTQHAARSTGTSTLPLSERGGYVGVQLDTIPVACSVLRVREAVLKKQSLSNTSQQHLKCLEKAPYEGLS